MLVKLDKTIVRNSDKPNENWTNDDEFILVDDRSALAKKIVELNPCFDFVLDSEGNIIDVTPTEKPAEVEEPTEIDKLRTELTATQEALDFLLMGGM